MYALAPVMMSGFVGIALPEPMSVTVIESSSIPEPLSFTWNTIVSSSVALVVNRAGFSPSTEQVEQLFSIVKLYDALAVLGVVAWSWVEIATDTDDPPAKLPGGSTVTV
jgi:hypothetical protein